MKAARVRISTEIVVFSVRGQSLSVLLTAPTTDEFRNFRLPGGIAGVDEDLDATARRYLLRDTGLSGVYLEQLYTFGRPDRDPRGRVVSVAYYALVPASEFEQSEHTGECELAWHRVDRLPILALDHGDIVRVAHRRLAAKLGYSTIGLQLMPRTFTLSALQQVFEAVLHEPLDKRNFRKRLFGMDCLEDTGQEAREGKHRPARLYRVKRPGRVRIVR